MKVSKSELACFEHAAEGGTYTVCVAARDGHFRPSVDRRKDCLINGSSVCDVSHLFLMETFEAKRQHEP